MSWYHKGISDLEKVEGILNAYATPGFEARQANLLCLAVAHPLRILYYHLWFFCSILIAVDQQMLERQSPHNTLRFYS